MPSGYSRVNTEEDDASAPRQPHPTRRSALGTLVAQWGAAGRLRGEPPAPGAVSALLFSWARPVIDARGDEITMALPAPLCSEPQADKLRRQLRAAAEDAQDTAAPPKAQLAAALHRAVLLPFWLSGLFRLLAEVAALSSPVLLQSLVEAVEARHTATALLAALLLLLAQVANTLALQQFIYGVFLSGGELTTSLSVLVFEKALRLPAISTTTTAGKTTNLIAKDCASLRNFVVFAHNFWAAPLSVLASTLLLLRCLGWPALAGVSLIPALIPLETRLASATKRWRKKTLSAADQRMVAVRDALGSIEALKLDPEAWEARVDTRVTKARSDELEALRGEYELTVANQVLMRLGPMLVGLLSFAVNALAGRELTPATAFSSLALFSGIGHPFHGKHTAALPFPLSLSLSLSLSVCLSLAGFPKV